MVTTTVDASSDALGAVMVMAVCGGRVAVQCGGCARRRKDKRHNDGHRKLGDGAMAISGFEFGLWVRGGSNVRGG